MKQILAVLALAFAGASHAAPTTFYFSGTTELHRLVDPATNTWTDATTSKRFSGSITVDGSHGTLTSVLGMSADVQSMQRITSSECWLTSNFQCSDDAPAPTNLLGFTLNLDGLAFGRWAPPGPDEVETSSVTKLRWLTGSSYTVAGGINRDELVAVLGQGEQRRSTWMSLGLTLEGAFQAAGDPYDPGQFPDLSLIDPSTSELRFNSASYSCTVVDDACQDPAWSPESLTVIGRLDYVGLAPQVAAEVPEPASSALVLAGALGMLRFRSRMSSTANPANQRSSSSL